MTKTLKYLRRVFLAIEQDSLKRDVFAHYTSNGIVECACCREQELAFLQLDHVYNSGKKHRLRLKKKGIIGTGYMFYKHLRERGYPNKPKLQILCANCHGAKRRINGGPLRYCTSRLVKLQTRKLSYNCVTCPEYLFDEFYKNRRIDDSTSNLYISKRLYRKS